MGTTVRPAPATGEAPAAPDRAPWGLWVFLTLLVWGLFAADRGLYQDDANVLSLAQEAWRSSGLAGIFAAAGAPTRRLLILPFFLGWATGEPVLALQLLTGVTWLATGWAAWSLARALFPGDPRAAWLAGTLTICATGDALTDSPVALAYQTCVLFGLFALVFALRFLSGRPWPWLAAACVAAAASVFSADGTAVALALAPLLFLAAAGVGIRSAAAAAAWCASLAPYGLLLLGMIRDPRSYFAVAVSPLRGTDRLVRTLRLCTHDVVPWAWPSVKPVFGPPLPHAIPVWIWWACAAAGLAAVFRALARMAPASRPAPGLRVLPAAAWCAAAVILTHAAYAGVFLSDAFYRTHVLSRALVSILLGLAASRLLARAGARRIAGGALVALFTGFGVAAGLARQDLYLAAWRRHRVELSSLVEEVPRAKPGATLLLAVPPEPAYMATEVPYLAMRWTALLWPDPAFRPRVFLWSVDAGSSCLLQDTGFRCRLPEEKACFESGTCPGLSLRWGEFVLLTWRGDEGRFRLEDEIPDGLLAGRPPPLGLYRPRDLVVPGPPDPRARRVLRGDVALARLLP